MQYVFAGYDVNLRYYSYYISGMENGTALYLQKEKKNTNEQKHTKILYYIHMCNVCVCSERSVKIPSFLCGYVFWKISMVHIVHTHL